MLTKHKKSTSQNLWSNSSCCLNFSKPSFVFKREPKFSKSGSIYYTPYYADGQKKQKEDFTNLRQKFHKALKQAENYTKNKSTSHKNSPTFKNNSKHNQENIPTVIQNNLYQIPKKSAFKFDRFGNRSYQVGQFDVRKIRNTILNAKNGFSFGRRLDLSRPLNFVPGPGSYISQQIIENHTITQPKLGSSGLSLQNKSSEIIINNTLKNPALINDDNELFKRTSISIIPKKKLSKKFPNISYSRKSFPSQHTESTFSRKKGQQINMHPHRNSCLTLSKNSLKQ